MTKKCSELVFISRIEKDGSGTKPVSKTSSDIIASDPLLKDEELRLHGLSATQCTYIVFMFHAYVVKLKKQ